MVSKPDELPHDAGLNMGLNESLAALTAFFPMSQAFFQEP